MRARHTRFNRIATTIVAGFAFASAIAGTTVLVLHNEGVIDMTAATPNIYKAEFYVDNALVYETRKERGEVIGYGYDNFPTRDCDVDGQPYIFIGWDLSGEGIPDILPNRIYSNFRADAVFAKFGIPDIDWTKVDFNQLLDLLNYLNIDLESFMNFFGLDWEDMLELLDIPIINYRTDYRGLVYFRNESFGDYNPSKHKWINAGYYSRNEISEGSVNPLSFAIDKAGTVVGEEADTVIELEYLKTGSNYPVICYEKDNTQELNSDSISLISPEENMYTSTGLPYSYLTSDIINILKAVPFSNKAIEADEIKYRQYVRENYTAITDEYRDIILDICDSAGISFDSSYKFVDDVSRFFKNNYEFNYQMPSYPLTCDPVMYFLTDAKVGIGRHFAAATTLMYRALGVPARYVQGYVDYAEDDLNTIAAIQAHSWCEIYVDGVGWLATDTAALSVSDTDLGFLFNTDNIDEIDFEAPGEGEVVDFEAYMKNTEFQVGDEIDEDDIICRAEYDSGDNIRVQPTLINYPDMSTPGDKEIQVFYHDGDEIFMDTIKIHVSGGAIEGIIVIDKNISLDVTYNGTPQFNEESLFFIGDEKGNSIKLRDGDYTEFYTISMDPTRQYDTLNDVIDYGFYSFKVGVRIYDQYGNDVTESEYKISNNEATKSFRITIHQCQVVITTGSKTITEDTLNDLYHGSFTYYCASAFTDEQTGEMIFEENVLYLYGFDYINLLDGNTSWTTLTSVSTDVTNEVSGEFIVHRLDLDYRSFIDTTQNYDFIIHNEGKIGVTKD